MSKIIRLVLAVAALMALAPVVYGQQNATAVEIALLPRFCWSQYVPNTSGDEFRIRDCGPAANHYCPGLLDMIRAKGHVNKSNRWRLLGGADGNIRYTERAIADYPKCEIREHVVASRAELNNLMTMFGYNRPKSR